MSITQKCTVSNCENKHSAKGFCVKHYNKWYRHGTPLFDRTLNNIRLCIIKGCENKHHSKGLCQKHYKMANTTPEYRTWQHIKSRCYNKNVEHYRYYGGRGIKVCDEWLNNSKSFLDYVGKRPTPQHSLDRIDNNGDYKPGNVRWATKREQCINRRLFKNNKSGMSSVSWHKPTKKWIVQIYKNNKTFHIGIYNELKDAKEARIKANQYYF